MQSVGNEEVGTKELNLHEIVFSVHLTTFFYSRITATLREYLDDVRGQILSIPKVRSYETKVGIPTSSLTELK